MQWLVDNRLSGITIILESPLPIVTILSIRSKLIEEEALTEINLPQIGNDSLSLDYFSKLLFLSSP